jgi:hypothetical protein
MDVNQKYCQNCHLISRNGFIITKIMSSQICSYCMGNVITLSECSCGIQRVYSYNVYNGLFITLKDGVNTLPTVCVKIKCNVAIGK